MASVRSHQHICKSCHRIYTRSLPSDSIYHCEDCWPLANTKSKRHKLAKSLPLYHPPQRVTPPPDLPILVRDLMARIPRRDRRMVMLLAQGYTQWEAGMKLHVSKQAVARRLEVVRAIVRTKTPKMSLLLCISSAVTAEGSTRTRPLCTTRESDAT